MAASLTGSVHGAAAVSARTHLRTWGPINARNITRKQTAHLRAWAGHPQDRGAHWRHHQQLQPARESVRAATKTSLRRQGEVRPSLASTLSLQCMSTSGCSCSAPPSALLSGGHQEPTPPVSVASTPGTAHAHTHRNTLASYKHRALRSTLPPASQYLRSVSCSAHLELGAVHARTIRARSNAAERQKRRTKNALNLLSRSMHD
jgi:hypothetical protein